MQRRRTALPFRNTGMLARPEFMMTTQVHSKAAGHTAPNHNEFGDEHHTVFLNSHNCRDTLKS
jgi:hypothetical protein